MAICLDAANPDDLIHPTDQYLFAPERSGYRVCNIPLLVPYFPNMHLCIT
jgi:hypothetical protein